jgi:hypothetical protein
LRFKRSYRNRQEYKLKELQEGSRALSTACSKQCDMKEYGGCSKVDASIKCAGMSSPLVGISAVNSLLFASYSRAKAYLSQKSNEQLSLPKIAIAGASAGWLIQAL